MNKTFKKILIGASIVYAANLVINLRLGTYEESKLLNYMYYKYYKQDERVASLLEAKINKLSLKEASEKELDNYINRTKKYYFYRALNPLLYFKEKPGVKLE